MHGLRIVNTPPQKASQKSPTTSPFIEQRSHSATSSGRRRREALALKELALRRGIAKSPLFDDRKWRERVDRRADTAHDLANHVTANGERVSDQRAVAAPWHGFGAHEG